MSSEITRFNHVPDWGMERDADGDYVLHSDHEAEVARLRAMAQEQGVRDGNEIGRLRAELQNAAKAALDATALACEKEREADALRVEVEKYQKAVRKVRARADSEGTAKQHGMQYVAGLRNAANMIDAAMGDEG